MPSMRAWPDVARIEVEGGASCGPANQGKYCRARQRDGDHGFHVPAAGPAPVMRRPAQSPVRVVRRRPAGVKRTDSLLRTVRLRARPFVAFCAKKVRQQHQLRRRSAVWFVPVGADPGPAIPADMHGAWQALRRCAPGLGRKDLAEEDMARVLASTAAYAFLWTARWIEMVSRPACSRRGSNCMRHGATVVWACAPFGVGGRFA